MRPIFVALLVFTCGQGLIADGWKAGVGRVDITPEEPMWLAGYAARKSPSTGVAGPIQVKALALEDEVGGRLVAITCDLLTMPRALAEPVARRLAARYALPRSRILLCASHSHSAPVIRDGLIDMYFLDKSHLAKVDRYTTRVEEALFRAACEALDGLRPADVAVGSSTAGFAINRRRRNPNDPIDHEVPVLRVRFQRHADGDEGPRQAVLFAYACHNTTLQGLDMCGDYAGFAQSELESRLPRTVALFAAGCAGDQNPHPRGQMAQAKKYGRELAEAVARAISGPMREVSGTSHASFGWTPLPLVPAPDRAEVEKQLQSSNRYIQQRARRLRDKLDAGGIAESYPYAAQVWRLGPDCFYVALAGEVVVDYALRLKRDVLEAATLDGKVVVLAYANDVPGYIPSERVLREGGYEGGGAMVYYGLHGPWASGVEEHVVSHALQLVRDAFRSSPMTGNDARLTRVWGEGAFTEGPAYHGGSLYFSDIPNRRILRIEAGNVHEFRPDSGKANGLAFDRQGRLVACEGADGGRRRVTRTESDGRVTVLAESWNGKRLNSPNDLAIDRKDRVYFSDPRYGGGEPREIDREAVYRVESPGVVRRAIDDVVKPNGLAASPDDKWLYVSDAGARKLYAYRLTDELPLKRDRLVFDFGDGRGVDGMEVDVHGSIYAAAGRGALSGIYIISPDGTLLDFISTPETATNCAFGEDGRTLFITAGKSVYSVRTRFRGHRPR